MALTVLFGCLMLGGCGIRPSKVDLPPGVEHDTFPRTYPDPHQL